MGKSYVRTERGERIDQPDFEHASFTSQRVGLEQQNNNVILGSDSDRACILDGFGAAAVGTVVTVTRGVALLGFREGGEIGYGALVADGDATKSIDINTFPDGTYGLYVKFAWLDGEPSNRVFWNPLAVTPTETVRNIPTRKVESWALSVDLTSPGSEWLKIYDVAKAGAALTLTDTRRWAFEGLSSNSYAIVDAEWGAPFTDRDTNRATFGVKSVYTAIRALMRQVQDIIGGTPTQWWKFPQSGSANGGLAPRSLTQLNDEKLARNGGQTMTGDLDPSTDNARDLGSPALRWRTLSVYDIDAADDITCDALNAAAATVTGNATVQGNLDVDTDLDVDGIGTIDALIATTGQIGTVTSNAYNYIVAQTAYQWLDASEFKFNDLVGGSPAAPADFRYEPDGAGTPTRSRLYWDSARATNSNAVGQLKLPQGVTLNQATFHGFNDSNAGDLTINIVRQDYATGTVQGLMAAGAFQPALSAIANFNNTETFAVDQNNVIDNSLYRYYVIFGASGGGSGAMAAYGLKLRYSSSSLEP